MKLEKREFKVLPISQLVVPVYQRNLDKKRVEKIANRFKQGKMGSLLVNKRPDGKYYLVDGQHRWHALLKLGILEWYCEIRLDMEYQEEAETFLSCNSGENKKPVSALEVFVAKIESGDKVAQEIKRIIEDEGFSIGGKGKNSIRGIGCLTKTYEEVGETGLRWVLKFIRRVWGYDANAKKDTILYGFKEFYKQYITTGQCNEKLLTKKMSVLPPTRIIQMYGNKKDSNWGKDKVVAQIIYELYKARKTA